jgi:A/G-specific adenine glycosylase
MPLKKDTPNNKSCLDPAMRRRLLDWYGKERQLLPWRDNPAPYRVWISEIMLQQTVITTVIPYFERWMEIYPDIHSLAAASEQDVLLLWEGLGYYSRARNILKTAQYLVTYGNGRIPADYDALVKLPGIGDYTACAILSIAFKQPYPVLDANVRRVFQRVLAWTEWSKERELELKVLLKTLIPQPVHPSNEPNRNPAGDFNEAIMQLGQTVCKTKQPLCFRCPLEPYCQAAQHSLQDTIPAPKKQQTILKQTALFIFLHDDHIWITGRESGLLKGLWTFPGVPYEAKEAFLEACVQQHTVELTLLMALDAQTHYYTVHKDKLFPFIYQLKRPVPLFPSSGSWVSLAELKNYPFPSVYRKIIGDLTVALKKS